VERRYGIPRSDIERVANHYQVSLDEAESMLKIYSVEDLLPARGYGLQNGVVNQELDVSCLPLFLFGLAIGGVAGCGVALLICKGG
jgi:hypothetical protein